MPTCSTLTSPRSGSKTRSTINVVLSLRVDGTTARSAMIGAPAPARGQRGCAPGRARDATQRSTSSRSAAARRSRLRPGHGAPAARCRCRRRASMASNINLGEKGEWRHLWQASRTKDATLDGADPCDEQRRARARALIGLEDIIYNKFGNRGASPRALLSFVAERLGVNELGESAKRSSSGTNRSSSRPLSAPAPPCSLLGLLPSYRGIRCFLPGRCELTAAYLLPQAEAAMCEDLQRLARCRRESAQRPVVVL
jgi:hypothetical protein